MAIRFSPKIEIINHFDNLINRVDIDIDTSLEIKFNDEKVIGELLTSSANNRRNFLNEYAHFKVEFLDNHQQYQTLDLWPESTKLSDYLKQVRLGTIEELRKAQEETLKYYELNSARFKSEPINQKNIDEFRSKLFAESFYFQINFTQSDKRCWAFNVFTFVTDFYMSQSDIDSLEKLINGGEKNPLGQDCVFDDKMVLIGLLYKYFTDNLSNFPNHVIRVCKQDISSIKLINFRHDYSGVNLTSSLNLSNLVTLYIYCGKCEDRRESTTRINLEGLCSLKKFHLGANSAEIDFSLRNLNSLQTLSLILTCPIDENIIRELFEQVPNIEKLFLNGNFSHFNLDCFLNLKILSLNGTLNESFNIDLFKKLCNQLTVLNIELTKLEEKTLFKLLDGLNFPNLLSFSLMKCNLKRLSKEFFNRFPILVRLHLIDCNLEVIEKDLFSNLKRLCRLFLCKNRLKSIEKNSFSNLKNLEILDLSGNESITDLNSEFIGVENWVQILLADKNFATLNRYWYKTL